MTREQRRRRSLATEHPIHANSNSSRHKRLSLPHSSPSDERQFASLVLQVTALDSLPLASLAAVALATTTRLWVPRTVSLLSSPPTRASASTRFSLARILSTAGLRLPSRTAVASLLVFSVPRPDHRPLVPRTWRTCEQLPPLPGILVLHPLTA